MQRMEEERIINKGNQSEWATSVVLVPKKDGLLRVLGDYKTTVNQCAVVDQYPVEEVSNHQRSHGIVPLKSVYHLEYLVPRQRFSALWMNCLKN